MRFVAVAALVVSLAVGCGGSLPVADRITDVSYQEINGRPQLNLLLHEACGREPRIGHLDESAEEISVLVWIDQIDGDQLACQVGLSVRLEELLGDRVVVDLFTGERFVPTFAE